MQKDLTDRSSASTFAAGTWWDLVRHRRSHVLKHIKTMSNIVKPWTPGTETCIFFVFFLLRGWEFSDSSRVTFASPVRARFSLAGEIPQGEVEFQTLPDG